MLKEQLKLRGQIERAGRRLQRYEGRLLWLRAIPFALGLLVALLLVDLAFHLGSTWRLIFLLGYLGAGAFFGCYVFWIGLVQKAAPRRTARHLEMRSPELGSSLMNFLDLEDTVQDKSKSELTRTMAKHAQAEHAEVANRAQLPRLVINLRLKPAAKALGVSCLIFASLCLFFWPFFRAHLARFFDPLGAHPPYSVTTLVLTEPTENSDPIVFGESLRILVEAKGHAPDQVELLYWPTDDPENVYRTSMLPRSKSTFVQRIDQVEAPITLMAQTPNERSQTKPVALDVYMNPKIESVAIEIQPPAYTGLPISKRAYTFNELRALRGSRILLRSSSNRPLKSGEIRMDRPLETEAHQTVTMQAVEENSVEGAFIAEASTGFSIRVTDRDGLHSEYSPRGSIVTVADRPPSVSITNPEKATLLALDASIEIQVEAFDDYGLRELRVHRAINGIFSAPIRIPLEKLSRRADSEWTLDFATIGVQAEDVVSIYAEAIDVAPEPQVSRSEIITITAISVEDYNSLLRQEADMARVAKKYEALRERFENLMEEQDQLLEKAKELRKQLAQTDDPEKRKEILEQLAEVQKQQSAINDALKALAQDMDEDVRDNPLYDVEKAFKQRMQKAAENIRGAAEKNQKSIKSIQKQMAAPDLSPDEQAALAEKLEAAMQQQRDQLLGQQEDLAAVDQTAEEMGDFHELLKNFNRYTALANQQRALAGAAAAYNREGHLTREDELALRDLALDQKMISDELDLLVKKFRSDAEASAETFPKAAASSLEFADAIEASRAPLLSTRSTGAMLKGSGRNSAELAEATAVAMESLIGQCNGSMGEMNNAMDRYLSATQPSPNAAGNTFQQMLENMRMQYGLGSGSMGFGTTGGGAASQSSGYSTASPQSPSLAGNESLASEGSSADQNSQTGGSGDGTGGSSESVDSTGAEGSLSGLEEKRRESESVRGESLFIEHGDIIDAYFDKITEEK